MSLFLLILGIIFFVGLVVIHELGHFIAARRGGVDVEEFGIGFPPKVWGKKMASGFEFTINLLPLGGFVRLKGENDADKTKGSFGAAPLKTKIKIMLAGVAMNLAVAYALLLLLAVIGMPKIVENQYSVASDTKVVKEVEGKDRVLVANIVADSPAMAAGLQQGDRLVSIAGQRVTSPIQVGELTKSHAGQTVEVEVERGGQTQTKSVSLKSENTGNGYLGVVSESGQSGVEVVRSTWSAPIVAAGLIAQFSELTVKGLGSALSDLARGNAKEASEQVSGPVGIFVILKEGTQLGINFMLMIIAIISLTLAIINALPIPALDGGRLFVTLLFKALRRPLSKGKEDFIHGTGFVMLMLLFVLITIVDVRRFF